MYGPLIVKPLFDYGTLGPRLHKLIMSLETCWKANG
jgi:hypothetical protein